MTFKLGDQLDRGANPALSFELYRSYIEHNRADFPPSALAVIEHPDWNGGSASRSPMHGALESMTLHGLGSVASELVLTLRKDVYVPIPFCLRLTYRRLHQLNLPADDSTYDLSEPWRWRYEQFLATGRERERAFTHQIEWHNGVVWSISAGEVQAHWVDALANY
jgi:hypothetical protein